MGFRSYIVGTQRTAIARGAKFGDVAGGNYTEFESDTGFMVARGDARAWLDFNFGVDNLGAGASAPDKINIGTSSIQTFGFDGVNTLEQVSACVEMNHNWAEGTTLYPHVHWYPTTAAAGSVIWFMEYAFAKAEGAVIPASATIQVTQAAGGVAWTERFASFPTIVLDATYKIGAQLHIRWYRAPATSGDNYGDDAALGTFGIHVRIDTLGSRLEYAK